MSTIQWLISSDLGTIKAGTNRDIPVTVYDPDPYLGPVTYKIRLGNTPETQLPPSLNFDEKLGYIWGYVEYEPYYIKNYNLTVEATKTYNTSSQQTTITNVFSLSVKGNVSGSIGWVSGENLGSIEVGTVSNLSVIAQETESSNHIKYALISGALPSGITLSNDGCLIGQADYSAAGAYTFTVQASSVYESSSISKTFTLTVTATTSTEYTSMYFRPFMSLDKRKKYQDFISDNSIFNPSTIYRYFDPNFGLQNTIKMILEFGIERVNLDTYTQGLHKNFYKRKFLFGDIKTAIAQDSAGNTVYEVVYVDIVDSIKGAKSTISSNSKDYYPASIDNMRRELSQITLANGVPIGINENLQPKFMQTPQKNSNNPSGYLQLVPLCYVLPGQGAHVVQKIKTSEFDFKLLNFEVDRLVVQNALDSTSAKYLILERQTITDPLNLDNILYESGTVWVFDDNVLLTRT